jgi:hypothetical protein
MVRSLILGAARRQSTQLYWFVPQGACADAAVIAGWRRLGSTPAPKKYVCFRNMFELRISGHALIQYSGGMSTKLPKRAVARVPGAHGLVMTMPVPIA